MAGRLIPASAQGSLDRTVYVWMTCVSAGSTLLIVVPGNLVLGLTPWASVAAGAFGCVCVGLYVVARRGRHYPRSYALFFMAALSAVWFGDGGVDGTVICWFLLAVMLVVLFFSGWQRWVVVGALLAEVSVLIWLDASDLGPTAPFATREERFLDLLSGFPMVAITTAAVVAIVVGAYERERRDLTEAKQRLEQSLAEIRTLRGLLPICGWCKNIRDDEGGWVQLEKYVSERTDAAFSHGICPKCSEQHFPRSRAAAGR
ncbi:MAG: hypothetical protein JNK82_45570 [Myxococcaceae bacterium]|nr:hypothetical protein [Myxococcaceae bacterium]